MSGINPVLANALANPPAANPQYWGQQMQNMNALQEYNAKQATADAYRQSIDANGNFDQAGFNARIARGAGAWNAGPTMQQAGQAQGAQAQGQQEQIAAHRSRMDTMLGQMTDLLQSGKPIQAGDVIASLNQAHFSPGEASQITADMNAANPSHDPNFDYTSWVKNHQASNLAAGAQIALRTPNMQFVNTPQGAVAVDTNANTTTTPAGSALPYGVSPETKVWNPDAYGPGKGGFVLSGGSVAPGTVLPPGSGGSPQAAPPTVVNRNPSLTVGQQANNSGNLMVPQGHALPTGAIGVIPAAGGRQVAAFPDVPTGIAAQSDNLAAYKAQGINTIAGAVNRWVGDPKADNTSYIADIAKAAGVDPNAPVDLTDPKIQRAFFMAQQPHESGASWLKPADVDRGIAMAQARRQAPQGGQQTAQGGQQPQQPAQPPPVPVGNLGLVRNPDGTVGTPRGGFGGGGTQVAGPGAPTTAPAQPTAPAAQAPAPAPAQVTPPAASPGKLMAAPPIGYEEKLKADVGGYVGDQAAYPGVMTRAQNMAHAYEALQQLQSATGKGAQGINDLRSWAQTLGIAPPGAIKEQQLMEVINKYTERAMLDAAGGSGTDLARQMQAQANPNTGLSTPANLELLRNDMGKTLQTMAAYKDQKDKTGAGYLDNRANVADATDPRGFVWNLYSPTEQASINAEVTRDKTGTAANKLHKAIGMSQRLNLQIPGLTAQ